MTFEEPPEEIIKNHSLINH
jgi:hypothetical protein